MKPTSLYAAVGADQASHTDDPVPAKPATNPQVGALVNDSSLTGSKEALIEKEGLPSNGDCQQDGCHKDALATGARPRLLEDMIGTSNVRYVDGWLTRQSNAAFGRLNAEAARPWKRPTSKRKEVSENVATFPRGFLARKIKSFAGLVRLKRTCVTSGKYSLVHSKHEKVDSGKFDLAPRPLITMHDLKHVDTRPPFHEEHVDPVLYQTPAIVLTPGEKMGIRIMTTSKGFRVVALMPGSPYEQLGAIKVGDYVVQVNAAATHGLKHIEMVQLLRSASAAGSEFTLTLRREHASSDDAAAGGDSPATIAKSAGTKNTRTAAAAASAFYAAVQVLDPVAASDFWSTKQVDDLMRALDEGYEPKVPSQSNSNPPLCPTPQHPPRPHQPHQHQSNSVPANANATTAGTNPCPNPPTQSKPYTEMLRNLVSQRHDAVTKALKFSVVEGATATTADNRLNPPLAHAHSSASPKQGGGMETLPLTGWLVVAETRLAAVSLHSSQRREAQQQQQHVRSMNSENIENIDAKYADIIRKSPKKETLVLSDFNAEAAERLKQYQGGASTGGASTGLSEQAWNRAESKWI